MTALTAWRNDILPWVRSVTGDVADFAVREACIDFCKRSRAIQPDLTPINVTAGVGQYTLVPPAERLILRPEVVYVSWERDPLVMTSEDEAREEDPNWKTATGRTEAYFMEYPRIMRLVKVPTSTVTGGLLVKASTYPTSDATDVADDLYLYWREAIKEGALSFLYRMKDKPWSDPVKAQQHEATFSGHCEAARVAKRRGFTNRPLRSKAWY